MRNFLKYEGLSAESYDLWWGPGDLPDEDFYQRWIEKAGGSALELACGTGRLLLPYLRAGLDIEGLDASPDMLAICKKKAEAEGLAPVLHEALMQEMDLGRTYRTLFIPFRSFMVLTDREVVYEALRRFREHLEPGGQLFISLFFPSYEITASQKGLWKLVKEVADGDRKIVVSECVTNDLVEQEKHIRFRYEVFRDGDLVETQLQEFGMRWYFRYEFELMLEKAGFREIFPFGECTDEEVRSGDGGMVFRAVR